MKLYEVTVRVMGHSSPQAPLLGAEVLLDGVSVGLTAADGTLTIPEVTPGTHTIAAEKPPKYGRVERTISIPETTSLTLPLPTVRITIYISTFNAHTGIALPGVDVYVGDMRVGATDSAGTLETVVYYDKYKITGKKSGYYDASVLFDPALGYTVRLDLIPLVYTVVVTVTGSQIVGALIYLDGIYVGATDAAGTLTLTEVAAGSHTIEARKEGYSPDSATITVPETTSVTLTLTPIAYTVSVHVEGAGPIASARVYIDGTFVGETDSAGNITITGVTAGTHTISAFKYGYEPASATISVPETTSVTLTLTLVEPEPEYSAVTILVRGKIWPPPAIEGAKVVLAGVTDYTDAGGYAFFDNVEYGTRYCTVSKSGYKTWSGPLLINAATEMAYIYLEGA